MNSEVTEAKPVKSVKFSNAVGIGILIALSSFLLGNRWTDIAGGGLFNNNEPVAGLPEDLDYSEVEQVYDSLRKNYDGELTLDQLLDGLKYGLADATGDPYTVYLNEEQSKQFLSDLNGTFTGIGAELGIEDDRLIIVAPLDGYPAQKAGLRSKDIIVEINGEDTLGITIEEAVSKIRGPKGTDVTLGIFRNGAQQDITITRDEIVIPSVTSEVKDSIGYIKISRFAEDTVGLTKTAAQDFVAQGVKGVVLDLRNDSGGYLNGAVEISGLWLDGDVVVEQRNGDKVIDTQRAPKGAILKGIPTVVLINEGSASASEIVAGALKDHKVATIVGVKSFGKGSVQELEHIQSGGVLKVTVARWFTPNGNSIDGEGIEPDETIKLTEDDIKNSNDAQLNWARDILLK